MRSSRHVRALAAAALLSALGALGACEREQRPTQGMPSARPRSEGGVLTSELIAGPRQVVPVTANPYVENAYVVAEGKRLYGWMNCAGCHGVQGGGGIGPPLADDRWIYGGEPATIYQTIVQGRPNGMPAYGQLADDQIWKIVAYVRSLSPGGGVDAASGGARAGDDAGRGGQGSGPAGDG